MRLLPHASGAYALRLPDGRLLCENATDATLLEEAPGREQHWHLSSLYVEVPQVDDAGGPDELVHADGLDRLALRASRRPPGMRVLPVLFIPTDCYF